MGTMLTDTSKLMGLAAALSLAVTPAGAAELPVVSKAATQVETGAPENASNHRYGYRRYRNRIDAGDVIAGVAILGTIAAIASAGRRDRYSDRYEPPYRDRDYRYVRQGRAERYDSRGMERAVDMCIEEVERGRDRVSDIDNASRDRDGWRVSGTLENGGSWNCFIDNDGRIRDVDTGQTYPRTGDGDGYYSGADLGERGEQWSDDAYARARASTRTATDAEYTYRDQPNYDLPDDSGPQPAYPGGPVPGEDGYGDDGYADTPEVTPDGGWEGDGRYDTAEAPDFSQPGN